MTAVRRGQQRQWIEWARTPTLAWAVCALAVNWVQQVIYRIDVIGYLGASSLLPGRFAPFAGRIAWDSGLYLRVAQFGYRRSEGLEAGFPLYALLIRWTHGIFGGYQWAAVLISMASGLAATVLFWRWLELRSVPETARRTALTLFLFYPYSFMLFGVAYSDALLVALVLGALVLAESDRWIAAGLVGTAATATRPTGLMLVPALVVLVLQRSDAVRLESPDHARSPDDRWIDRARSTGRRLRGLRIDVSRLHARHLGVLLSLGGVGAYMVFLYRHTGDPLYFWTIQRTDYGHPPVRLLSTWLKARFFLDPTREVHHVGDVLNEAVSTVVVLCSIAASPLIGRRFGWAYGVLMFAISSNVWLAASWFAPGGRYLLPVIPFLAAWLAPPLAAKPSLRCVVLVMSAVGSLLLTIGFAGAFGLNW